MGVCAFSIMSMQMLRGASTWRILVLLLAAGCASRSGQTPRVDDTSASDDERAMLAEAQLSAAELESRGIVLDDPELTAYLTRVAAPLAPPVLPPGVALRYHVIRSADVTAFALPQGDVYLPIGLLVQLENEAQLAQVLGHEMTHLVAGHPIDRARSRRRKAVAVQVASIATLGVAGVLATVPYRASVASYGRDQEEEADAVALDRVRAAGYDPAAAASVYDRLAAMIPGDEPGGDSIYSTHPSLTERSAFARQRVADTMSGAGGRVDAKTYRAQTAALDREYVRLLLQAQRFGAARRYAERTLARDPSDAWAHCAVARAHHGAADNPVAMAVERAVLEGQTELDETYVTAAQAAASDEREHAGAAYQRCLALDARAPAAHRGLGLLAHQRGDRDTAQRELAQYLALAPDAADRCYILRLLSMSGEN